MNKRKLSSLQIGILTFFISQSFIFTTISSILFKCTKQNIWISLIIGFLLGLFFVFLFLKIQDELKDKNIFEYNKEKFKTFGNLLNILLVLIVLIMTIVIFNKIIIFININYLSEYPLILIGICFLFICIYAVHKGIDSICRTSQILFIISIITFIIFFCLSIYYMNFNNIKPILNMDIGNISSSFLLYMLSLILPLILLFVIPKDIVKSRNNYNKSIIFGYISSFIVTFLIILMTLLILGNNLVTVFEYPIYISLKEIEYFHFIDHLENIFSSYWIFNSFIFITLGIYFIKKIIIIYKK